MRLRGVDAHLIRWWAAMLHQSGHMPLNATRSEVVMITGASAGVGRAVAQAFGRRGASVGLFARGRAGLEATSVRTGRFDRSTRSSSRELVISKHHRDFAALGVALAAATLVYFRRAA